jgi:hypothetical protein
MLESSLVDVTYHAKLGAQQSTHLAVREIASESLEEIKSKALIRNIVKLSMAQSLFICLTAGAAVAAAGGAATATMTNLAVPVPVIGGIAVAVTVGAVAVDQAALTDHMKKTIVENTIHNLFVFLSDAKNRGAFRVSIMNGLSALMVKISTTVQQGTIASNLGIKYQNPAASCVTMRAVGNSQSRHLDEECQVLISTDEEDKEGSVDAVTEDGKTTDAADSQSNQTYLEDERKDYEWADKHEGGIQTTRFNYYDGEQENLIWIDKNVTNAENTQYTHKLMEKFPALRSFDNAEEACEFIQKNVLCSFTVILAGSIAKDVIPLLSGGLDEVPKFRLSTIF